MPVHSTGVSGGRDEQARGVTHRTRKETPMAVTTGTPAGTAIRPFRFQVSEEEIDDLRARIAATRWPEKEPVDDRSQGVQLAAVQALARYWETEYDFGRLEARLGGLPHFVTE